MGRSASCLKIITCGSDSADQDDLEASEIKGDKKGWSFRKRSARHRVLSNSAISETSAPATKEIPESADDNFKTATDSDVPEKVSAIRCADEKPQLSAPVDAKVSEAVVATKPETVDVFNVDEAIVIFIQASIRGFLAHKALLKLKSVIKLQSAVRGHLVRSHAVGTLRCVQAIVKMQALVRARRARQLTQGTIAENNADVKHKRDGINLRAMEMENANKPTVAYISIEKLLGNKFARQLLDSTPKEKPINIKCDISKSDSTWQWLERWMSASSAEPSPIVGLMTEQQESKKNEPSPIVGLMTEQQESKKNEPSPIVGLMTEQQESKKNEPSPIIGLMTEQQESKKNEKLIQANSEGSSEVLCRSTDSVSACKDISAPAENEDNLVLPDEAKSKIEGCNVIPSAAEEHMERSEPEKFETFDANESSTERESTPPLICDSSKTEPDSLSNEIEVEIEQPKHSGKRFAPDQLETLGKKPAFGSRKASNPSFIAAQSKFEEINSTVNSNGSINTSNQDVEADSNGVPVSSGDTTTGEKAFGPEDNVAPNHARVQVGGSECDTELSITSTLDSPDRYDDGNADRVNQAKVTEERSCSPDNVKNELCEVKESTAVQLSTLSDSASDHPEKRDDVISEPVTSIVAMEPHQDELNLDRSTSDVLGEIDSKTIQKAYRSSPEASPRSHITIPESQGTPASQVSVNTKGSRTDKTRSSNKRKSLSAGKRSLSNTYQDSGTGSPKQLPKDQKNGKRRSSIGSARPDNEQEPRDSSSSNSIPHFMQATESARAKVNSNNSPRSSPDVHDREIYVKKRHSLPGSNDRQGSPRIQRSTSQAQQGAKANGTQTQERKWLR
ncbi:protein IQ-DOMAIN 32 [Syzygium oleosum]|uniref:protein IQ-DOMAIN 32 n=1 Tax=Syzygium oleosum TaxID=219896 RepID=UPI0024BA6864|nr:protein IQ-DOMAIN 32 [Syzygium oleosum]